MADSDDSKAGERDEKARDEKAERDEKARDEKTERDDDDDDDDERDEKAERKEVAAEPAAKPAKSASGKARKSDKVRRDKPLERTARATPAAAPAAGNPATRAIVVGILALAAGAAGGWFGHDARAKAKLRTDSAIPAGSGSASAGPCGQWEQKICAEGGAQSAACQQAKVATELLTPDTCETALLAVPATLAKVKAARATCDTLVTKLCNDLPKGSQACEMVKARTPSFPPDRCKAMLDQYDQVLGQLKMMDQQAPGMGGHPAPGAPPGAPPPGAPPGAPPPGAPPMPHAAPPPGHP